METDYGTNLMSKMFNDNISNTRAIMRDPPKYTPCKGKTVAFSDAFVL